MKKQPPPCKFEADLYVFLENWKPITQKEYNVTPVEIRKFTVSEIARKNTYFKKLVCSVNPAIDQLFKKLQKKKIRFTKYYYVDTNENFRLRIKSE